ncbi:MAG: sulfite exporter TauE/SafE family protein [Boseongicola sp. SB0664_bin_43]|uniref:Probable membrane transporter protein n=1 Tax=Boseongicola sp. SB0664_bin_43 TaxID=2604844 RepID=A0A6B0Y2J4_9RHOB|nr:sulfite exporter TauE/SafE family protein [Boseongicola sp. SB0664_bin_43]MYK30158.1 sulfite exporter TauE/SafE family protein [Boseongicola sp. SB0670_bin_30]
MFTEFVMIALAAFVGSLVSGLGGFGGSFVVIIVLTPVLGAKATIPLIAVYAICANLSRAFIYRRTVAWKPAIQFTLASLPGTYAGARFLKEIPETAFLGFLGAVLILVLPARRHLKKTSFEPGLKSFLVLGLLFGFMSGTAAGSGMLVIAFFNSIGLSGPLLLGTDAVIGLANALTRSGTFYGMGLLDQRLGLLGLFMGAMTIPGTRIASRLVHRMGNRTHDKLIEALIAVSGLVFIARALTT